MREKKITLNVFIVAACILFVSTTVFSGTALSPSVQQKSPQGTSPTPAPATPVPVPSSPAPSVPGQSTITGPSVTVPDQPSIRNFDVTPSQVIQGGHIQINWAVAPGVGGSSITNITIRIDDTTIHSATMSVGYHSYRLLPSFGPGRHTVRLTATNGIGRTSERTEQLSVTDDAPVIHEFSADPSVTTGGQTYTLRWRVGPAVGGSEITSVRFQGSTEDLPLSGERSFTLRPDTSEERIQQAIVAINRIGRTTGRMTEIEVKPLSWVRQNISVHELKMAPGRIDLGDTTRFLVKINNISGVNLKGVEISLSSSSERRGRSHSISGAVVSNAELLSGRIISHEMSGAISSSNTHFITVHIRLARGYAVSFVTPVRESTRTVYTYEFTGGGATAFEGYYE